MAPIACVTAFAKHSINFNRRNLASQTIQLDVAIQQWELLVLDLILSGLRILVTNRKGFLKPSHMVALCFLICFRPGYLGPEHVPLHCSLSNRSGGRLPALVLVNFIGYHAISFLLPLFSLLLFLLPLFLAAWPLLLVFSLFSFLLYFWSPNQHMHIVGKKERRSNRMRVKRQGEETEERGRRRGTEVIWKTTKVSCVSIMQI